MKSLLSIALVLVTLTGCTKKTPPVAPVDSTATSSERAVSDEEKDATDELIENFQRVYFETDSSALTSTTQEALRTNARILGAFPRIEIEVQGHADERGTIDYNLQLGQRRGEAVVDFLRREGVAPGRLKVVSYGEERPLDTRSSQTAWAKNRRAEFRVINGDAEVAGTVTSSGRPVGGP